MDLYGRSVTWNGSPSGQKQEWVPIGGETGLEEPMWRSGLNGTESYPERPGVLDCVYYMRTGFCGYGSRCRYNHPRDRAAVEVAVRGTGKYPERVGEPLCQFYLKTRTCKFGASCKFNHPKHAGGSLSHVPLNTNGHPLRPGEKECSYYLKTGQCKFGISCRFDHPQPAVTSMPETAPHFYPLVQSSSVPVPEQYGGASISLRVARTALLPGSYVQGAYSPMLLPPGVVPIPGWSPYSAPVSPVLSPDGQPGVVATSLYGVNQLSAATPTLVGAYPLLTSSAGPSSSRRLEQAFPERPGERECQYYMRTGDCKFRSSCRYHHPCDRVAPRSDCYLSPLGLPLHPVCRFLGFLQWLL